MQQNGLQQACICPPKQIVYLEEGAFCAGCGTECPDLALDYFGQSLGFVRRPKVKLRQKRYTSEQRWKLYQRIRIRLAKGDGLIWLRNGSPLWYTRCKKCHEELVLPCNKKASTLCPACYQVRNKLLVSDWAKAHRDERRVYHQDYYRAHRDKWVD